MSSRLLAVACLAFTSCGYALVQGGQVFGADTITVVPFLEDEPAGVSSELTAAIIERLGAAGIERGSGATIEGRVVSLATVAAPSAGQAIPLYRVVLRLSARLVRGDEVLWRGELSLHEDFLSASRGVVSGQPEIDLATEANRRAALVSVTRRAAMQLVEQLELASSAAKKARAS